MAGPRPTIRRRRFLLAGSRGGCSRVRRPVDLELPGGDVLHRVRNVVRIIGRLTRRLPLQAIRADAPRLDSFRGFVEEIQNAAQPAMRTSILVADRGHELLGLYAQATARSTLLRKKG